MQATSMTVMTIDCLAFLPISLENDLGEPGCRCRLLGRTSSVEQSFGNESRMAEIARNRCAEPFEFRAQHWLGQRAVNDGACVVVDDVVGDLARHGGWYHGQSTDERDSSGRSRSTANPIQFEPNAW